MRSLLLLLPLSIAACQAQPAKPREEAELKFPAPARPVGKIVSPRWSDEGSRDKAGEATEVMDRSGIAPGMTVADIGAGEGYYTVRLSGRVGPKGRVLAQDVTPGTRDALAERVARDGLENVSVKLGYPDNPRLPENFDRVMMVHMYHEIASPYSFLWYLRPSVKPNGRVIVVDADRPTWEHGTPPALLKCEFEAVGYKQVDFQRMPNAGGYLAAFEPEGNRPEPQAIKVCKG
jgi:ubiquinone/menaquinone biosynthesis C-methylase UbiE